MEKEMNLKRAKRLQKQMLYKKIFYDTIYKCYRLIKPSELYEYYLDGQIYKRQNVSLLVPIINLK